MRKLYSYYRSSASYRVRIALNFKGLDYEYERVHLTKNGGEQHQAAYRELNPQRLVPTFAEGDHYLTQSLSIMEYLDEKYPQPPLLPKTAIERARVRSLAQLIACEIQPLVNLRVVEYLKQNFSVDDAGRQSWYQNWIKSGLQAFETALKNSEMTGEFCHGDQPTMADMCLVPQVFNAKRFQCPLVDFPLIVGINDRCLQLKAFQDAHPDRQPDAE